MHINLIAILAGWISLHHAVLLAPPTLVSHLLTHGCSPFAQTRRHLTALDIVTAHSILPGREDVRLLLEEAMREEGWTGGRMEERRRTLEKKALQLSKRKTLQEGVGKVLDVVPSWWGQIDEDSLSDSSDDEDDTLLEDSNVFVSFETPPSSEKFLIYQSDSFTGLHFYASLCTSFVTRHLSDSHYGLSTKHEERRACQCVVHVGTLCLSKL